MDALCYHAGGPLIDGDIEGISFISNSQRIPQIHISS